MQNYKKRMNGQIINSKNATLRSNIAASFFSLPANTPQHEMAYKTNTAKKPQTKCGKKSRMHRPFISFCAGS